MDNVIAVKADNLSKLGDNRYVIVDKVTGEILDDAQGYGYKSPQKAYACFGYKRRSPNQVKKERCIKAWLKENKSFARLMEEIAFEIAKGSWGPDSKFDAKLVEEMLKENNLKPGFSAADLLRVWRRG